MQTEALIGIFAALSVILGAQEAPKQTASDGSPLITLESVSSATVPSLGIRLLALPQVCTSDGSIFALTATTAAISDLVSIAPDRKTLTNFGVDRINDLKNPRIFSFFASDTGVYLLVDTPESEESKDAVVLQPDGGVKKVKSTFVRGKHYAIPSFRADGTYQGSVLLDVPFSPHQFGVFPKGGFPNCGDKTDVLGTQRTTESQLALVASSGQLLKKIDLKQDPNVRTPSNNSELGDWFLLTSLSEIVPAGTTCSSFGPQRTRRYSRSHQRAKPLL